MTFPLQPTQCAEPTEDMMPLGPLRAGLTATEAEWLFADPHHFLNVGAHTVQAVDLGGQ
jgi:hypothetical protein